jgi:hypothetical protein
MTKPIRRRGALLLGLAALVLAGAGGVAYATIPDSAGIIHACFLNQGGNLRVIDTDAGAVCRPGETPLSWNQSGSAGGPLAWAHVANGVLDAARSKNVVSMTPKADSTGLMVYCFVLTATPVNVVATAEKDGGGFTFPAATVSGTAGMSASPCDPGASAAVYYGTSALPPPPLSPASSFFVTFN